jgi:hypothetical protein
MQALRENEWLRVLVVVALLIVLVPIGLWQLLNNAEKAAVSRYMLGLALNATAALGYCLPAVVFGAAWGWIKYSRSVWLWTTGVLLAGTMALYIFMLTHNI